MGGRDEVGDAVVRDYDHVPELTRRARSRFDADARRDPREDDGPHAAPTELEVELRAGERVPAALW